MVAIRLKPPAAGILPASLETWTMLLLMRPPRLLGGAFITEVIFSWPGVGQLAVNSILQRDFPVVQGTVLLVTVAFVVTNLIIDIAYAWVDPRIRYG